MPTNSNRISIEAFGLRLGFLAGLTTRPEVVGWADSLIMQEEDLPFEIFDISHSGSKSEKEVVLLLSDIYESCRTGQLHEEGFRFFCANLRVKVLGGSLEHAIAADALYQVAFMSGLSFSDSIQQFCLWASDEFNLVEMKVKDEGKAKQSFNEQLDIIVLNPEA